MPLPLPLSFAALGASFDVAALPLPSSLGLSSALAVAGTEPSADLSGLGIVLAVLLALGVAAFFLTRKPPAPPAPPEGPVAAADLRDDDDDDVGDRGTDAEARRKARALRRAAQGGVKLTRDGKLERVGPLGSGIEASTPARPAPAPATAPAKPLAPAPSTAETQLARERVAAGLQKTRKEGFVGLLGRLFAGKQIDASILEEVEEVLFRADLGVHATRALLDAVKQELSRGELASANRVWASLEARARAILDDVGGKPLDLAASHGPAVLMVVGVNGSGKTTTIGKLAHRYAAEGRKVLVGAGDTFRAAAVDQLEVWCQRAGVEIHRGKEGADPASVCFAAVERARREGHDLVICDTAGRLHTNAALMGELEKVTRVIGKAHPGAPHEVLLVLDATMGQNAVVQARQFGEALSVTAIALTKLDGTAKGGVVLAIAETLKLPVKLIGVGEKMEDLRDFDAELFCQALFQRDEG